MENREIKFRGKDVITGNWAYGYYYPSKGNAIIRDENGAECIVLEKTVSQFTGLLDKNGKEIWENDIIKQMQDDWAFTEGWEASDPRWEDKSLFDPMPQIEIMRDVVALDRFRYWLKEESFGYEGENLISPEDCIVIGNIFENNGLLNGNNPK